MVSSSLGPHKLEDTIFSMSKQKLQDPASVTVLMPLGALLMVCHRQGKLGREGDDKHNNYQNKITLKSAEKQVCELYLSKQTSARLKDKA